MTGLDDVRIDGLDEAGLARLIRAGEEGGVERKAQPPSDGLGPSVAAFANSGGGWLLIGVRDDGTVCGFTPPGRAQPHDWLRELLHRAVDPLPAFRTAIIPTPDGDVLVIRILPSAATPHVLRNHGVVYVREPGGKRPVDSQAKLIAMCQAPERAEQLAVNRLHDPPLVLEALTRRMDGPAANGQTRVAEWHVAATPMHVPDGFAERVLAGSSVREVERAGVDALRHLAEGGADLHLRVMSRARGFVAVGASLRTNDEFELTVDSGGTTVARWSTRLFRGTHHLSGLADDVLTPLLRAAIAPLVIGGAEGPVLVHGFLAVTSTEGGYPEALTLWAGGGAGELAAPSMRPLFLGGRLGSGSDEALRGQADSWMRELGRAAGLDTWE